MSFDIPLFVLLTLGAVCYLAFGIRLILARRGVGTVPIGLLFVIISVWVAGGAVELMSSTFYVFSLGRTGHFFGSAFLPVAAYFSFREYTGRSTSLHRIAVLSVIPFISVVLAATNFFHEFMWYLPIANEYGEFLTRPTQWGPWFLFVHAPYSYIVIGVAMLSLLVHSKAVARAHRRGLFLLVAACVAPLLATVAYDFGLGSDTLSFVPIIFTILLPGYVWVIFVEQLVEFTPLAYETVFQNMQDPVVIVDDQDRIIGLNRGAESLLDITETSALMQPLSVILGDGSPEVIETLETGQPSQMMTATGRYLHVQVSPMKSSRRALRNGKVLMFRDVSDVEKAQAEIRANEAMLRTLIDHSVNGIIRLRWLRDEESGRNELRCIFANEAASRFLSTDKDKLIDGSCEEIMAIATSGMEPVMANDMLDGFHEAVERGDGMDVEVHHASHGKSKWLRIICQPFGTDIALTFIDITDGKAKEQHMESIARSDPLTGVLNRRGFESDASQRLSDSDDDATGALLFIDLDDFKQINDTKGHEIGDQILQIAAKRLRKSLRSCDIIGRPGGDEFVALVPDVTPEVADRLAKRLATALQRPYLIGSEKLDCPSSIGLALYPKNANTLTGLMREADQAMYRAKERCRVDDSVRSADRLEKAM